MFSCTAAATLWLAFFAASPADEKPDFAKELKEIKDRFSSSLRAGGNAMAALNAANRLRRTGLEELAKKAEAVPAEKLTGGDEAAIAEIHSQLGAYDKAATHAAVAVRADPKNVAVQEILVRSLAIGGNPAKAEEALKAAQFPEKSKSSLQLTLAQSYARAEDMGNAARVYNAFLDAARPGALKDARESQTFARNASTYVRTLGESRRAEVLKRIEGDIDAFAKAAGSNPDLKQALTELRMQQVGLLVESGSKAAAMEIVNNEKKDAEADPKPNSAIARRIAITQAQAEHGDDSAADAAVRDYAAYASNQVKTGDTAAVGASLRGFTVLANGLSYDKPKTAMLVLSSARSAIDAAKAKGGSDPAVSQIERMIPNLTRSIESTLKRSELVGKPAKAWAAESWVNGTPLSADALKGKVVLIDFWAVWCGPCIATFPHLREWNEKFEKDGLVVLGFTQYYKYGWNEATQRAERMEDISKVDERAATEKFAKHHKLSHRLVYFPGREVSEAYGVTGIPQAVLIDRNGVVRMIRVGSGEKNAKALEEMIHKLIAEKPSTATGG